MDAILAMLKSRSAREASRHLLWVSDRLLVTRVSLNYSVVLIFVPGVAEQNEGAG